MELTELQEQAIEEQKTRFTSIHKNAKYNVIPLAYGDGVRLTAVFTMSSFGKSRIRYVKSWIVGSKGGVVSI